MTKKDSPLDKITAERLEIGAKVMTSVGVGLLAYGFASTVQTGIVEQTVPTVAGKVKDKITDRVKKTIKNIWDVAKSPWNRFVTARKAWEQATNDTSRNSYQKMMDEAAAIVEPYLNSIRYLQVGLALVTAGLTYWLLSHPDVVKEAMKAVRDVAVRVVDEISEAGEALAKYIDVLMPSILELVGIA